MLNVELPEGSRKEQISRQIQYIFADMAGWWLNCENSWCPIPTADEIAILRNRMTGFGHETLGPLALHRHPLLGCRTGQSLLIVDSPSWASDQSRNSCGDKKVWIRK